MPKLGDINVVWKFICHFFRRKLHAFMCYLRDHDSIRLYRFPAATSGPAATNFFCLESTRALNPSSVLAPSSNRSPDSAKTTSLNRKKFVCPNDDKSDISRHSLAIGHRYRDVLFLSFDPDLFKRFSWEPCVIAAGINQQFPYRRRSAASSDVLDFAPNVKYAHLFHASNHFLVLSGKMSDASFLISVSPSFPVSPVRRSVGQAYLVLRFYALGFRQDPMAAKLLPRSRAMLGPKMPRAYFEAPLQRQRDLRQRHHREDLAISEMLRLLQLFLPRLRIFGAIPWQRCQRAD